MRTILGEITLSGRGVVNLPAKALKSTGWQSGDLLFVEIVDNEMVVLFKRPVELADGFAGRLTRLFPDPEDTRLFLREERAS
jgi:hypothetical protein